MNVLHLISGLGDGGAPIMLERLAGCSTAVRPLVVSMTDVGPVGRRLAEAGVEVAALGMSRGRPSLRGAVKLARLLARRRPDLIQSWLYHADLLGAAMRLAPFRTWTGSGTSRGIDHRPALVWGIHHVSLDPRFNKRSTIVAARLGAALSRHVPDRIVCCSQASRRAHCEIGYDRAKMAVIANGVDPRSLGPDPAARRRVRRELGVAENTPLIACVARFHPLKDHATLIAAAAQMQRRLPEARLVLCGEGVTADNPALSEPLAAAGLGDVVRLLGPRSDVRELFAACDLATLSSISEALPLALVEAMACALPCAATAVGDCAELIGATGRVVPPSDPAALAAAWAELLELEPESRRELGRLARRRIELNYSVAAAAERYRQVYEQVLVGRPRPGRQALAAEELMRRGPI